MNTLRTNSPHFLSLFRYPLQSSTLALPKSLLSAMATTAESPAENLPNLSSANAEPEPSTAVDASAPPPPAEAPEELVDEDAKFGFKRSEMYKESFPVKDAPYDRHVFLAFKSALSWPARVEDVAYDPLPGRLALAMKKRKDEMPRLTLFTVIEGGAESGVSDGDVLIFPDMIKYKNLTQEAVDDFVEDILIKESTSTKFGSPEKLTGFHMFVCAHTSRDKRCGVCGPVLIDKLNTEIELRGLKDKVFVSPCSHVGGHKYAGNVIVFGPNSEEKVMGHWYGYVTPDDVPLLLEQHVGKGELVKHLWSLNFGEKAFNNMTNENQVKDVSTNGSGGNQSESTPQIQFGSGLPLVNLPQAQAPDQNMPYVANLPNAHHVGILPDKFDGQGFKTWSQKMHFFLSTMNLDKYLMEEKPEISPDHIDVYAQASLDNWIQGDFVCRGYITDRMIDSLYNVYCTYKTAKQLWETLNKKYKTQHAGIKRLAVARFLNYKMVDSKPVMDQVKELQLIVHEIIAEGMEICETFQVSAFIEKLPPSWDQFKHYLLHKQKAMKVEDLVVRLRIEASNKKANESSPSQNKANMAEHQDKGKKKRFQPHNSNNFKKQSTKFSGKCYKCNKIGHKGSECCNKVGTRKKKGRSQANLSEGKLPESDICDVMTEVNMVDNNPREWWYDTGATRHICSDKSMFTTYQKSQSEEQLFMGNSTT